MNKYLFLLLLTLFFNSCEIENRLSVSVISESFTDSVYVKELITNRHIADVLPNEIREIELNSILLGEIKLKGKKGFYLTILNPKKELKINIDKKVINTNSIADSLLNVLLKGTISFINDNSSLIFRKVKLDTLPIIFEKFRVERENMILSYSDKLDSDEVDILNSQNNARIFNFLLYYGRFLGVDANDDYFDFINHIKKPSVYLKNLPSVYLYKYEIEYLRHNDSISSIKSFVNYIEENVEDEDLSDFLKISYFKWLIDSPSYFKKHTHLLTVDVLEKLLSDEKANRYMFMAEKSVKSYIDTRRGSLVYNFTAYTPEDIEFNLSEQKDKVVFIDVWATWCGPCISQRPNIIALAEKYKGRNDIVFLTISVNENKDKWLNYISKQKNLFGLDLIIRKSEISTFRNKLNVTSIPRYILIDKNGEMIYPNMGDSLSDFEKEINLELNK